MFVTAEKERRMFIIFFFSIFCQLCFKQGQAERVQAMKALNNRSALSNVVSLNRPFFSTHYDNPTDIQHLFLIAKSYRPRF